MGSFYSKYKIMSLEFTEDFYFMAIKIDAKFKQKVTCIFQNDVRNLANFQRLKNKYFILESKTAELNQNKNSKQLDQPDAVRKLYFTLKINE